MRTQHNFTVIEGPDAVGKATQSTLLAKAHGALLTSFPRYEGSYGPLITAILKGKVVFETDLARGEALQAAMVADRLLWKAEVADPAHETNTHLVADRYWMSGFVYGQLDGMAQETLVHLNSTCVMPDVAILIDLPTGTQMDRLRARNREKDIFEAKDGLFMAKVRTRYLSLWEFLGPKHFPDTMWAVVDGDGTQEEVQERIRLITG